MNGIGEVVCTDGYAQLFARVVEYDGVSSLRVCKRRQVSAWWCFAAGAHVQSTSFVAVWRRNKAAGVHLGGCGPNLLNFAVEIVE
jgi:hypothetical protein